MKDDAKQVSQILSRKFEAEAMQEEPCYLTRCQRSRSDIIHPNLCPVNDADSLKALRTLRSMVLRSGLHSQTRVRSLNVSALLQSLRMPAMVCTTAWPPELFESQLILVSDALS